MISTNIAKGHVYRIARGSFAIVNYSPAGCKVIAALLPEAESVTEAIVALGKERSGNFVRADRDTELWGEAVARGRGYYETL